VRLYRDQDCWTDTELLPKRVWLNTPLDPNGHSTVHCTPPVSYAIGLFNGHKWQARHAIQVHSRAHRIRPAMRHTWEITASPYNYRYSIAGLIIEFCISPARTDNSFFNTWTPQLTMALCAVTLVNTPAYRNLTGASKGTVAYRWRIGPLLAWAP